VPTVVLYFASDGHTVSYLDYYDVPLPPGGRASDPIDPVERSYLLYAGAISRRKANSDTVPTAVAILWPIFQALVYIVAIELIYFYKGARTGVDALSTILFFFFDFLNMLFCVLMFMEVTKLVTGVLRPDYLARCMPNRLGKCTVDMDSGDFVNGSKSFVSGHSAISMAVGLYASIYLIWGLYYRPGSMFGEMNIASRGESLTQAEFEPVAIAQPRGMWAALWHQTLHFMALLAILAPFGISWGIGISRIVDGRHSPADVVGGVVLGSLVCILFVFRAFGRSAKVVSGKFDSSV
jgi:diacylglycerol diphosphate phosphatase / phosphatidate phosphatase